MTFDFTDDPAKDGAKMSLCLVHLPAAALIMTIDASFPPLGIVLVRMSPRTNFIYLSDQILLTRTQWPKDALIPDLARGCCLRSSRGPASNLATGSKHKRFILGFWLREVALHLSQELAGEQGLQST